MHEPFAPQLAMFVASRPLLALYREFVFPSVPSVTGLLPSGIDDIRANVQANTPLAIDVALSRAAVVVYDSGGRSRLQLEYVQALRNGERIIVVAAPAGENDGPVNEPQRQASQNTLGRPREMSGWPESFVMPLLTQLMTSAIVPSREEVAATLSRLSAAGQQSDLILTALALLEREMRKPQFGAPATGQNLPTLLPVSPTGGAMARLQEYFGNDYRPVVEAVSFRHDLLQNLKPPEKELKRVADSVANIARQRLALPPLSGRSPESHP
ncbi:hypothetical protein [Arthrobacter sp. LAR12-1-1.1]|uniref:hypothetical protein n=1 Tax=Arthrobacter sp. LAR12-1-1.1 TaxID=3135215 RepID=UPI0034455F71